MAYRDDDDAAELRRLALTRRKETLELRATQVSAELRTVEAELREDVEAVRAARLDRFPLLARLRVASPCPMGWDALEGQGWKRHCAHCRNEVYDISAVTTAEAERLLRELGSLCVRIRRRPDGTIMTADCAPGLRRQRRLSVLGAAAAFAVATGAYAASPDTPPPRQAKAVLAEPPPKHPTRTVKKKGKHAAPPIEEELEAHLLEALGYFTY